MTEVTFVYGTRPSPRRADSAGNYATEPTFPSLSGSKDFAAPTAKTACASTSAANTKSSRTGARNTWGANATTVATTNVCRLLPSTTGSRERKSSLSVRSDTRTSAESRRNWISATWLASTAMRKFMKSGERRNWDDDSTQPKGLGGEAEEHGPSAGPAADHCAERSLQDLDVRRALLAVAKDEVLIHLQQVIDALSSGSLEIEMYHQDTKTGHSEVNLILKGDYLGANRRVHLISTQDWSTFQR